MKTQEELDIEFNILKNKYETVYTVTVPVSDSEDEETNYTFFIREMDRATYKQAINVMAKDSLQAIELLMKNLWVGGDDVKIVFEDFKVLRSLESPLAELFNTRRADIKKN